jgi:hypothetical protein
MELEPSIATSRFAILLRNNFFGRLGAGETSLCSNGECKEQDCREKSLMKLPYTKEEVEYSGVAWNTFEIVPLSNVEEVVRRSATR